MLLGDDYPTAACAFQTPHRFRTLRRISGEGRSRGVHVAFTSRRFLPRDRGGWHVPRATLILYKSVVVIDVPTVAATMSSSSLSSAAAAFAAAKPPPHPLQLSDHRRHAQSESPSVDSSWQTVLVRRPTKRVYFVSFFCHFKTSWLILQTRMYTRAILL